MTYNKRLIGYLFRYLKWVQIYRNIFWYAQKTFLDTMTKQFFSCRNNYFLQQENISCWKNKLNFFLLLQGNFC